MQLHTIKEDALLRQMEALDKHIARASTNAWAKQLFESKRKQLWREYKLCRVIKEK